MCLSPTWWTSWILVSFGLLSWNSPGARYHLDGRPECRRIEQRWSPFSSSQIITALLAAAQCYSVPDPPYCYICKCLDVILSNHFAFSEGYVEHLPFTDHALMYSISNTQELSDNLGPRFISRRHWKIPDNQEEQLENALLCTFKERKASGINEMWEEWKTKFLSALDLVAPVITTKVSSTKRRCP